VRTNTIPEIFSARIQPYLKSFSRKSWRDCFLRYTLGLILTIRFRSISELARRLYAGNIDSLHHFLCCSPWRLSDLREIGQMGVTDYGKRSAKPIRLIIDDTPIARNGKQIEGLGVHHSAKGLIKGLCAVTAVVKIGSLVLNWTVLGYRPKRRCPAGQFCSKVELALRIIEGASGLGPDVTVLMDAWYACKKILNRIAAANWRYVAAIKSNRTVVLEGRKAPIRNLAQGPRLYKTVKLSKKRKVRVAKREVILPGIGRVLVFITKLGKNVKFLISNDLALSEVEAVRLYAERFCIETFHRDIKQHLGLGELWMRSWQAVQKHWTLCAVAYNTLQLWNAAFPARQRNKTFGQIIRHFRSRVAQKMAAQWCRNSARVA
jgi:SRSO17 transposase